MNEHRPVGHARTSVILCATARVTLMLICLAIAGPAAARDDDRSAPATIEADRAEIQRADGLQKYFGDVVFLQGTLRITGERMTIRAPDGSVRYAESFGSPATTRQQTDAGEVVDARARRIEYHADDELVILSGDAVITRGGERFTAGRIRYRTDTGRVVAGPGDGEEQGERVRIRIEPASENGQ